MPALNPRAVVLLVHSPPARDGDKGFVNFVWAAKLSNCYETTKYSFNFLSKQPIFLTFVHHRSLFSIAFPFNHPSFFEIFFYKQQFVYFL